MPFSEWGHGSNRLKYFSELEKSQWYSREKLEDIQRRKLHAFIRHAYENVPYYHNMFKSLNLKPDDIRTQEDLQKLPILTKDDIQNNLHDMVARNKSKESLLKNATGGSTGKPLTFYQDKFYWDWNAADKLRHLKMMNFDSGEKCAYLWGADRDSPQTTFMGKIGQIINRSMWLNTFNLTEEMMSDYAQKLQKFKPKVIIGYATSLYLFAEFVKENNITGINPTGIQSSAEKLFDFQRGLIESIFNCKVFDRYGCREVGNIAHECKAHDGLHISSEIHHVEFVQDDELVSEGEVGDIIVTNLTNYAMPFIRYEIGDRGSFMDEMCECGRGLPLMKSVEGRVTDNIVTASGKYIHGVYFTHLFYGIEGVKQFQVIQESIDKIVIKIVATPAFDINITKKMEDEIHEWIDEDLQISFEFVDLIPVTETGKYRFTISKVDKDKGGN